MATEITRTAIITAVEDSAAADTTVDGEETITVTHFFAGGGGAVMPENPLDPDSGYATSDAPATSYTPTATEDTSTVA